MRPLASLDNPRVKQVVKLRRRSHRDAAGETVIEGVRELGAALDNEWPVTAVFICPDHVRNPLAHDIVERCRVQGSAVFSCAPPVFAKMSYREHPDGILAVAPMVRRDLADLRLGAAPMILVASSVEKSGNLGAMLRTADAAGADAVIVCDPCTDVNNPNVIRASLGAVFARPVVEASTPDALAWLRAQGVSIVAAAPAADAVYTAADLTRGVAIVVGAEHAGLGADWLAAADQPVRIPMRGRVDSLNVSVAAALLLYEAIRQRDA